MLFSDFYKNNNFRYSIEVFPPKTEEGVAQLIRTLQTLEEINPAYVSVTYGAMGSTRDHTKDLAFRIYDHIKAHTAFHFTCVGMDKGEIREYVEVLYKKGVDLVVALRGDLPPGMSPGKTGTGLNHANELVEYLRGLHDFSIAVAGYPEKHPEARDIETDVRYLKQKVDTGADIIITQLFFDNAVFYRWLEMVRQAGIKIPVIPGIMPILKLSQVQRITQMCGATLPQKLVLQLEACGDDDEAMREVGIKHAIEQCQDLRHNGVQGIHFYSLNKSHSILKIVEACKGGGGWI